MSEHFCQKDENCVLQAGHSGPCNHFVTVPAPAEPAEELLCKVTGNTCGSDTWPKGLVCPCEPCQSWLESQPAAAEYTCPRCGSKIWTHICMKAEPVAGETKPISALDALARAEMDEGIYDLIPDDWPSPAPAVAAPAEGKVPLYYCEACDTTNCGCLDVIAEAEKAERASTPPISRSPMESRQASSAERLRR